MGIFDEILAKVKDEDKAVLAKYPELGATVAKLEEDLRVNNEALMSWEKWRVTDWDEEAGTTRATVAYYQQLVEAQNKIKELETAGVTDMTFAQMKEQLQKEGLVLSKQDVEAAAAAKLNDFTEKVHKPAMNQVVGAMETIFAGIYPLGFRHKDEFGEVLDPNTVLTYMNEHKVYDPRKAYDEMVAGKRNEKADVDKKALETKHQEELQAAEQRGAEKAKQELAMGVGGSPTDLGGPAPAMGHLERARMESAKKDGEPPAGPPPEARLGDGVVTNIGYRKWLNKQGSAGTVQ